MSLSFEDAVAHPVAVLGPRLGTAFCLGLETGVILNLFYRYWKDSSNTSKTFRAVVLSETVLAVAQTAIDYYAVYHLLVSHFGDWDAVMDLRWTAKVQSVFNFLLTGVTKAVFICRCWSVSTRKLYPLASHFNYIWRDGKVLIRPQMILGVLYAANEVLGLYAVIRLFSTHRSIARSSVGVHSGTLSRHLPRQPIFTAQLVIATSIDVIIAFILLSTMPRTRFRFYLRYPLTSSYRLLLLFWETLVFPLIFTLLALITYLVLITESLWSDFFQNTIGQIYVFSLFAYLNSARSRRRRAHSSENVSGGDDVSWRNRSQVENFGEGFEVAEASHWQGSDFELETFEQAPASVQFHEESASREALSLSIPEKARVRYVNPEGDAPSTPL